MRPSFILSKGERREGEGLVLPEDLLLRYAEVYASRFQWKGTPKDMPLGFIEKALFFTGGVAPVRAFGDEQLIASVPVLLGLYAQPVTWEPVPAGGSIIPPDLMKEYKQDRDSSLFCLPMEAQIRELCVLMADTYNCLRQTITAMKQPVILQGAVGGEINIRDTGDDLRMGRLMIPTLDKTSMPATVLDLGGKDHTQNLISTINALDCEILARMGIKSAGTEKASGVTSEETLSITQELQLVNQQDYELRKRWTELPQIRKRFPDLEVIPSPGLQVMEYAAGSGSADDQGTQVRSEGDDRDTDRKGGSPAPGYENNGEDAQ